MLMSVDGKISTGDNDNLDVDQDYKEIDGLKEGLSQYYDLEQKTDLFSFNTARVLAKIGINDKKDIPSKTSVSFVLLDNHGHLLESGIKYLSQKLNRLYIITNNKNHLAFSMRENFDNIEIIYREKIDFNEVFESLYEDYNIENITIQSGGTLNTILLRSGLIDKISIVVAPALIGGKNTPSLLDGESLHSKEDLLNIKTLKLEQVKALNNNYLLLEYLVNN